MGISEFLSQYYEYENKSVAVRSSHERSYSETSTELISFACFLKSSATVDKLCWYWADQYE